jgi:mono/diheme cytochrome c family protein
MHRSTPIVPLVLAAAVGLAMTSPTAQAAPDGKAIYTTRCASCHQATGQGVPGVFPPLAGAEIVNGPGAEHIKIVLKGLSGPIKVKGKMYNGAMPPHSMMSDADIAAVINFERAAWGNKGTPVTPAQVKAQR